MAAARGEFAIDRGIAVRARGKGRAHAIALN
jgi:hypothetical protein